MSSPLQLHSERNGRARELSVDDLARLVWKKIARARDFHWLFKGSLQPYRGLAEDPEPPSIPDAEEYLTSRLRVSGLARDLLNNDEPFISPIMPTDLDLLLDLIELLHAEIVAEPIMVAPPDCTDIEGFDKAAGQALFREEINPVLALASPPLELLPIGHVVELDEGHRALYRDPVPDGTEAELRDPVEHALSLFLGRGATLEDKRVAVKQLADALEHLRPEVDEQLLSKDERDLFQIANRFAIRHNKPDQKRDYDKGVWLDWIFHVYLATVRAVLSVRDRPAGTP
jgi:hypothetical protein